MERSGRHPGTIIVHRRTALASANIDGDGMAGLRSEKGHRSELSWAPAAGYRRVVGESWGMVGRPAHPRSMSIGRALSERDTTYAIGSLWRSGLPGGCYVAARPRSSALPCQPHCRTELH